MNDSFQLDSMEPLIPPEPIAFWPPAPGWYLIGFIILMLMILGLLRLWRNWKSNGYRREAMVMLQHLAAPEDGFDVARLNELLKQTALARYNRDRVASLTGKDWINFLNESCSRKLFDGQSAQLLFNAPYAEPGSIKISQDAWSQLLTCTRTWINIHKIKG